MNQANGRATRNPWPWTFQFQCSAIHPKQLPWPPHGAELAFLGRSNCGKSSLINALAGRKLLAKVSRTPGKTQLLNLFVSPPSGFHWVDLPGYGYAQISKHQAAELSQRLFTYLRERTCLKALYGCLDVRRGWGEADRAMVDRLSEERPDLQWHWIFTKLDKLRASERAQLPQRIADGAAPFDFPRHPSTTWHLTSSRCGWGIESLREAMVKEQQAWRALAKLETDVPSTAAPRLAKDD